MGVPSNTYKTYEAVGIREDLSDMVNNISPMDTQFSSAIGTGKKPGNTKVEWLTDTLAAAASNAQLEGDDRTASAVTAATRLYNMCQIMSKPFRLSDTNEEVDGAGNVTTEDYQTTKQTKELAKDREYAYLRGVRNDGAAGTARQMRGALNWTTTNLDKAADATLNADGTVTGGTARDLTETILAGVLQNIFTSGGNQNYIGYSGPFQKRQISAFAGAGNYRKMVEKAKLDATVDVYVGDFGTVTFKPHRIMPTDVMFICDHSYWKKRILRSAGKRRLAKTGDSELFDITCEESLEAKAEAANGRITTLTTS